MRIGIVCPYSMDEPGGVQKHVIDCARILREKGHYIRVLAPGDSTALSTEDFPDFLDLAGKSISVPYNGSIARITFNPQAYKLTKKWIIENQFDLLHIHEPNAPSLSMLALMIAKGPIVATFHTSTTKSLWLNAFQGMLRPYNEKILGKIAVSELARRWQMGALGSDAIEIPNGVFVQNFINSTPLNGYPSTKQTIGFLGRFDESRKGFDILVEAMPEVIKQFPNVQVLVVGGGDTEKAINRLGELKDYFIFLGKVSEQDKASALKSMDIYVAPQTSGESFGIVLVEAMAAGTAVVASDLPAFQIVLGDGEYGYLFKNGDPKALSDSLIELLSDEQKIEDLRLAGQKASIKYDWSSVIEQLLMVYETVSMKDSVVEVEK